MASSCAVGVSRFVRGAGFRRTKASGPGACFRKKLSKTPASRETLGSWCALGEAAMRFPTTLASRSNPGGAGREGAAAGEGAGGGLKGGGLTAGVAPKVAKAAAAAGDAGAAGAAGAGAGAGLGGPGSPGGPGAGPLDKIFPKI